MDRYNSYGYGDSIDAINQQLDALECSRCPAPAVVAPVAAAGGDAKDAEIAALRAELAALKAPSAKQVEPSNFAPNPASALSLDLTVPLSVIIFGATGDLAKKKLFPALYQLILLGHFPRRVNIVGYGRRAVPITCCQPISDAISNLPITELSSYRLPAPAYISISSAPDGIVVI